MIVTFCGHSDAILTSDEAKRLKKTVLSVLKETPDTDFYLGGYGNFDNLCNRVLKGFQKDFPLLKRVFVTPYLDPDNAALKAAKDEYDEILYPFEAKVFPKYAIIKRNLWIIDNSDLVVGYIFRSHGGAAQTFGYALRKGKQCVNLYKKGEV